MTGTDGASMSHGRNHHYFDPDPGTESKVAEYVMDGPRGPITVKSDSGVFSRGSLDKATAVLLDNLRGLTDPGGDILDLGCGAGPIALWLASAFPGRHVLAVDTNRRALDLCRANADANGLTNITCAEPGDVPANAVFALVCSNPPIRIGKEQLHDLLLHWLARMSPHGRALMVVGKNLGADSLQRWLGDRGWPTERVASSKGFRVLSTVRSAAD